MKRLFTLMTLILSTTAMAEFHRIGDGVECKLYENEKETRTCYLGAVNLGSQKPQKQLFFANINYCFLETATKDMSPDGVERTRTFTFEVDVAKSTNLITEMKIKAKNYYYLSVNMDDPEKPTQTIDVGDNRVIKCKEVARKYLNAKKLMGLY